MNKTTYRRDLPPISAALADAEPENERVFTPPSIPLPTPPTWTISALLDGFPVAVQIAGDVARVRATIARLKEIGASPPPQPPRGWETTPDGLPLCPKHGAVMRKRERQGDTWFSHNTAGDGEPDCYCRGYAGKDSPGWDK